ncbi:MAG: 3-dehydroquinate synthase, partial [Planctomycetes bacterium]|nr:3-dehydroquinate synthase [Planctomycetota bacterium]
RLVRMPSTVLAQNDAGIGVKNGVNAFGQKNFFGTFAPPYAVINDLDFLDTLDDRHWRNGVAEAVKVAVIKDVAFFKFIEKNASAIAARGREGMEKLVRECARIHVEHTGGSGDPFEFGSARPLDFGHWSAHWIESESGGEVSHGEGVALGIALDSLYAEGCGLITNEECDRIFKALSNCGFALWHNLLGKIVGGRYAAFDGLKKFQEHLGGKLTVTLPKGIGGRVEVNEIDSELMGACIRKLEEKCA